MKKSFLSVDGNTAAALASYNFTEVAGIYPITPSSPIPELVDVYAQQGKINFFGSKVKVVEMQSEGGAAAAVHGALQAGSYAATYTASQGLLLMIPNIYKMVGELLPGVIHVAARAIATRALSIFGDHQDIYAARPTGIAMICSHSVQEVADLTPVAHLVAMEAESPIISFFDGFRTSHEVQNVEFIDDAEWKKLLPLKQIEEFRARALNPHGHAVTRGGAENGDIYFQGREAQNLHNEHILAVAEKYFKEATRLTGREYAPFTYYGAKDADRIIIAMGSITETTHEVIDALNAKGEKVGLVKVHLYRPFSAKHLVSVIPASVKKIAVLDRTKEIGAPGEPLYMDVIAALEQEHRVIATVVGGRYGLSSKDTQPKHVKAVYDFLNAKPWNGFTTGIVDDVTHLSIPVDEEFHIKADYASCLFYGLGSDGTVSANKSSIKIIGDETHQYAQAYFEYDSRKSGGVTRSHLRFGPNPIRSTYYVQKADFLSCSLDSYVFNFDMLRFIKEGGTFLLNTNLTDVELVKALPNRVKYQLATKHVKFYIIDANKIAEEIGMGRHTNTILQSSFFYLNPSILPYKQAVKWMKEFAYKSYAKKGEEIVAMNNKAIDSGAEGLHPIAVDPEWAKLPAIRVRKSHEDEYFDTFVEPIVTMEGDDLPVSKFTEFELVDGTMQNNITFKEERSISDKVPHWTKENCIQCNQCAFVCPHATIRPFLLDEKEVAGAPEIIKGEFLDAMGPSVKGLKFRIQVSPKNCVGCAVCAVQCPGKGGKKALEMVDASCSSIYSSSTPLTPFCTDKNNDGVAWANSLFEDNAEYGYGMRIATDHKLGQIISVLEDNKAAVEPELQALITTYVANVKDRDLVRTFLPELIAKIKASKNEQVKESLKFERDFLDKSVWIIGGDGWAYDIGFGGLDHVLASDEDVNILVLDTELYSNTGGQASKSSQTGSINKFTAGGKTQAKKNLATIAMSYGHVYVAQVAIGANYMQTVKAIKEAESYHGGPSIVIAYSPCINHGIKGGLSIATLVEKSAVESGYFPIFRYDPRLEGVEGKSPLTLDCKEPDFTKFRDFVMRETRFNMLPIVNPEHAEELLVKSEHLAKYRWEHIKKFGL
ncbi:MAG: pyruvate:ferredoxin (flavodoxin) oxidoreductase [Firmicutes bacterium]|nr:pyruvate:ferredoxin (flavodoxin) oxidoreductase [Bacillota bacterium]